MQHTPKKHYKALSYVGMLLITISLTSYALAYKVISIHGVIYSAAALVIPFRYLMGDIIAEVYGYHVAKKFIWFMIICGFLFSGIVNSIIYLPSPPYWNHQAAYNFVLGNTLKVAIDASLGVIVGSMLNVYLISKWKLFTKGKYFWLRSIGSSIIGELTQYVIVLIMLYYNVFAWEKILQLIILDYSIQVALLFLATPLTHIAVYYLKRYEQVDVFSHNIKFNPFALSNKES